MQPGQVVAIAPILRTHVTQCRFAFIFLGIGVLGGLQGGCASSRVLANPLPVTAPDFGWNVAVPDQLTVEMHQLILRDGGGSWVKGASWDEYVLTIRNDSGAALEIQNIELYSDKLPAPEQSSTSRKDLDARTHGTLKGVGIIAGVGIVGPSALIVGSVGTSGGILAASSGAAATAAVGIIAIPVGLIGGTVYVINRHKHNKEDNALIERKLVERGFNFPLEILPGAQVSASAFFPITPSPNRLLFAYSQDSNSQQVALVLPGLAGLHLKPPRHTSQPVPGA